MNQQECLSRNLRAVMTERNYRNESEFARAAKCSQKTINNLLNGRFAVKLSTVGEISQSLKIPVNGLLADIPNPTIDSMIAVARMFDAIGRLKDDDYDVILGMIDRLAPQL